MQILSISSVHFSRSVVSNSLPPYGLQHARLPCPSTTPGHYSNSCPLSQCFFIVQLSHSYMTTGKTLALTRWTFVDKVRSLFFNMLSRLIIAFLPKIKRPLISWLQLPSGTQENKICHCFHFFPIYLQ